MNWADAIAAALRLGIWTQKEADSFKKKAESGTQQEYVQQTVEGIEALEDSMNRWRERNEH